MHEPVLGKLVSPLDQHSVIELRLPSGRAVRFQVANHALVHAEDGSISVSSDAKVEKMFLPGKTHEYPDVWVPCEILNQITFE